MQNFTLSKLLLFLFMGMVSSVLYGQVTTFVYTGSQQTYTAEFSGDYQLEVWGAQGGAASPYAGGKGGYSSGIVHLTAGQTIYIYVGQSGRGPSQGTAWNGGGAGICCGAGGGGATDIRIGGTELVDRIIVAGGGGGGSNDTPQGNGGDGGGLAGLSGTVGLPGTQSSGYQLGVGESNSFDAAGGGGGYWGGYDGGDGTGGSGGGGSGYIGELNSGETIAGNAIMPDPDGGTMTGNTGDGVAVVTRLCDVPELTVTPSDTVCLGTMVTITATSVNEGTYTWNNGITNGVPFFPTETTTYTALSSDEDDCEAVVTITVGDFINPTPIAHNTTLYLDANGIATLTAAAVDDGSYDNCGIDTMYLSQDTFGCEDVGDLYVTLTVTDIQGNVDSAIVTVTVLDTISPVIVCQDATIALDETGYAKLSSGSKGKKVLLLWDTNNSSTQSLKTKIEEAGYEVTMPTVPEYQWNNTNPPLDDFDAVIHLDGTTYLNAMSSDAQLALVDFVQNQGGVFIHTEWDVYEADEFPIQTQMDDIVILQRYLGDTEDLTYTVVAGQESHPVLDGIPASFVIPNVGFSSSNLRFYSEDPAVMLMTDQYGTAAVAVREFGSGKVVGFNHAGNYTDPGALVDINVQQLFVNALNWGTNVSSSLLSSMSDNCDIAYISLSQLEFGFDDLGKNTVEVSVTDIHGNVSTCSSIVTVIDTTPPTALCSNFYIADIGAVGGSITINRDAIDNGSYDNGEIVSYSLSQTTFTCNDLGDNIVILTVADGSNNVSTCHAVVTLDDPNAPVFDAVGDVSIELGAEECETGITYPAIVASDGCDVTLTLLEGLGPDGSFPVGTTTEKWEAKDLAGNADTMSFNVIVTSQSAPSIDVIADIDVDSNKESVEVVLKGISDLSCLMDGLSVSASTSDETIISSLNVDYENMAGTGLLTVGLEKGVLGSATVTVKVENTQGGFTEESFVISVMEINDTPVLTYPVEDQTVNAARVLKIPLSPVSGEYFTDKEDQVLTLTVVEEGSSELPVWATLSGDTLICEPVLADTGCVNIIVEAADTEGATASDTFTICVDGYVVGVGDVNMESFEINMYPNPTRSKVNLEIETLQAGEIQLMVLDISGRQVLNKTYRSTERIVFDLSNEVSGMYFVKLNINNQQVIKKLILDRN